MMAYSTRLGKLIGPKEISHYNFTTLQTCCDVMHARHSSITLYTVQHHALRSILKIKCNHYISNKKVLARACVEDIKCY